MDAYDPATVFSAIDEHGRYAYGNQPPIARWNLTRFAEALLPLLADDADRAVVLAQQALDGFDGLFQTAMLGGFRRKLGLMAEEDGDAPLVNALLDIMKRGRADFTLVFRRLGEEDISACRALFGNPAEFDGWESQWRARFAREATSPAERQAAMAHVNPLYIPRNHRIEAAIEAAVERQDFAPFESLLAVLARPYNEQPGHEGYALPPTPHERVLATFCGT
jgi:uncharacterized protein YdiU (UPF0061 family)